MNRDVSVVDGGAFIVPYGIARRMIGVLSVILTGATGPA
jgi:hypothetical protein